LQQAVVLGDEGDLKLVTDELTRHVYRDRLVTRAD
jgi:hypothetical protein